VKLKHYSLKNIHVSFVRKFVSNNEYAQAYTYVMCVKLETKLPWCTMFGT